MKLNKPCKLCGKIIENPKGLSLKNRIYCSKNCQSKARKGVKLSNEWRKKLSEARKNSPKCKGEMLYNWKGGNATLKSRMKAHNFSRRAKLTIKIDVKFLAALAIAQKNKCFYCDEKFNNNRELDHLTSVKNGGNNQKYNLIFACKKCNSKKRAKNMEDYLIENCLPFDKWENIYSLALVIEQKLVYKKNGK